MFVRHHHSGTTYSSYHELGTKYNFFHSYENNFVFMYYCRFNRGHRSKYLAMVGVRKFQACARCRNHGIMNMLKGHKKACIFKQCNCEKCLVTKDRQSFIAKEIAMHRYEIKNKTDSNEGLTQGLKLNFVRSKPLIMAPKRVVDTPRRNVRNGEVRSNQMCSRCRNHGVVQLLRGHKNLCVYSECICERCEITQRRREIMAKQIKDYRSSKISDESTSSPEVNSSEVSSPETDGLDMMPEFDKLLVEQFVDYEPVENSDLFFMIQSLFEKYATQNAEKRVQLIYAFAHLTKGNWDLIERSLEKGKSAKKWSWKR